MSGAGGTVLVALGVILGAAAALALYVRLAPSDPARWHRPVTGTQDRDTPRSALRVRPAAPGALARFDAVARAAPRCRVLAGTPEEGRVTYIARSRLFGFPDYVTAEQSEGMLRIFSRLRFGQRDMGVNARRLEGWLRRAGL